MSIHTLDSHRSEFASNRSEIIFYRGYDLLSRKENAKCIGELFKNDVRIAYCETTDLSSSLQHLRDIVDNLISKHISERMNAIPSQAELSEAIRLAYPHLSLAEKRLLSHFQSKSRRRFTLEELMMASDSQNTTGISLYMGQLGRMLCDLVGFEPPTPFDGRDPFLAQLIEASENCSNEVKPVTITLTESFTQAISALHRPLS